MLKKRRSILSLVVLLLLAFTLTACGGGATAPADAPAADALVSATPSVDYIGKTTGDVIAEYGDNYLFYAERGAQMLYYDKQPDRPSFYFIPEDFPPKKQKAMNPSLPFSPQKVLLPATGPAT